LGDRFWVRVSDVMGEYGIEETEKVEGGTTERGVDGNGACG